MTVVDLIPPPNLRWSGETATAFTRALLESAYRDGPAIVILNITASSSKTVWRLIYFGDEAGQFNEDDIAHLAENFYPGIEVDDQPQKRKFDYPFWRQYVIFGRADAPFYGFGRLAEDITNHDPLSQVVKSLGGLHKGERLIYQVAVVDRMKLSEKDIDYWLTISLKDAVSIGRSRMGMPQESRGFLGALWWWIRARNVRVPNPKFSDAEYQRHRSKLSQPLYTTTFSLQFDTPTKERLSILTGPLSAIVGLSAPPYHVLTEGTRSKPRAINSEEVNEEFQARMDILEMAGDQDKLGKYGFFFTASEVAAVWHLPYEDMVAEKGPKMVPMPKEIAEEETGIGIGGGRYAGRQVAARVSPEARTSHMLTIGKTGYGKSTLLNVMVHQEIAKGYGVGVLDPKGDLIQEILRRSIPTGQEKDVVIWDLSDAKYPPPLNLLQAPEGMDLEVVAELVTGVFEQTYPDMARTRMEDTLYVVLLTLSFDPTATPRDAVRLFAEPDYRNKLAAQDPHGELQEFWKEWDRWSETDKRNRYSPIVWRMRQFYRSNLLRRVMCNPVAFDLNRYMSEGRIILISLKTPEGSLLSDEHRKMLGAMWIALFEMYALNSTLPKPFYLHIDEAQDFTTSGLATMLNRARARRLYINLSQQTLEQLKTEEVRAAVLGNVGAITSFSVGAQDANILARYMAPSFASDDLMNLPPFTASVRLKHPESQPPPFTIKTLPPPGRDEGVQREMELRQLSRKSLGLKPHDELDVWYKKRYATKPEPAVDDEEDTGDPID